MHIRQALSRAHRASLATGRQLFLLVDTAQAEGGYLILDRWGIPYRSLFADTPEEPLLEIAPLLIPTGALAEDELAKLFEWAQDLALEVPAVCWFTSTLQLAALADHLRQFHVVGLSDQQSMLMRWYDTRVLQVWCACLTDEQFGQFSADASDWHYVDRSGRIAALDMTKRVALDPGGLPPDVVPITLTEQQFGLLVSAADLDAIILQLRRILPDEVKRVKQTKLLPFVSQHQQDAVAQGLSDLDRQIQYVILALYTSGQGVKQPEFKTFMAQAPQSLAVFSDELQSLSDAVWCAGVPLWQATGASASV